MRGTIGDVVIDRGFGFVTAKDGREFFFHRSALQGTDLGELVPGVAVEFDIRHDAEGAINVRLAADAMPAADHEVLPSQKIDMMLPD